MESTEQQLPPTSPKERPPKVIQQENHKKRLAMFGDVLKLVRGRKTEIGESATTGSWTELYKEVPPFESALELNNGVRNAVDGFVSSNFPQFREALEKRSARKKYKSFPKIKEIAKIDDNEFRATIVNNAFDTVPEDMQEDMRYVFLAEASHVVKRIESTTTRKLIETATPEQLQALGLNENLKQLAIDLLDVSLKSDPMYIRMKALGQKFAEAGVDLDDGSVAKEIEKFALKSPGEDRRVTTAEAFPKESAYISRKFRAIAGKKASWIDGAGGQKYTAEDVAQFSDYLSTLANFYEEKDPQTAAQYYQRVQDKFVDLSKTSFPLLVLPPTESMDVIPYLDPELSVYTKSPESEAYEQQYDQAKGAMSESLGLIGEDKFKKALLETSMNQYSTLGSYGINLTFRQAAQENPVGMIFLDEQLRQMSSDFPKYLNLVGNFVQSSVQLQDMQGNFPQFVDMLKKTEPKFAALSNEDMSRKYQEYLCTMTTVLHEFSHPIYLKNTPEAGRMGNHAIEVIDECKADSLYRGLVPAIVDKGGVEGNKELWADAMLAASLQVLHTGGEEDVYTKSNIYAINSLFEAGENGSPVVVIESGKLKITDYDEYYKRMLENGKKLLGETYENPQIDSHSEAEWLAKNTRISPGLQKAMKLVEQQAA